MRELKERNLIHSGGNGESDLARRIEEKLREREERKKVKKKRRKRREGREGSAEHSGVNEEPVEDRRECNIFLLSI
jgi:hypothetical protein